MRTTRALLPVMALAAAGLSLLPCREAKASETTRVASSFEEDNPFDLHFGVGYNFQFTQGAVLRELPGGSGNQLAKDLVYQKYRHTVNVGMEIGLYRRLSVYAELPIVVQDTRNYGFDQRADGCTFPDDVSALNPGDINCVNKTNSSTLRDGIVPRNGFDARSTSNPYGQYDGEDTELIFNGPARRGIDQIHVGLKYGILSQDVWSHLPNWVLAFEGRFAVGAPMRFSRDIQVSEPSSNRVVGRGIHELGLWTALSRRYRYLEPFFGAHWRQSLAASGSEFDAPSNSEDTNPMSEVGFYFGTEIVPWERKTKKQKVALIFSGAAQLRYNGREYSEVWELLADSPALVGANNPAAQQCNEQASVGYAAENPEAQDYLEQANAAGGSGGCFRFNGITNVDNYAVFSGRFALDFHLGKYARLMLGTQVGTTTQHFLTSANRGEPTRAGDPDIVDPDTADVNPLYRDVVDNVGRRYAIDDLIDVNAFLDFLVTF